MMKLRPLFLMFIMLVAWAAHAEPYSYSLALSEAEKTTLQTSNRLKSFVSLQAAAEEEADAQYQTLLPKLSLQGNYQYFGAIPNITIFGNTPIPFGTNSVYSIGPVLNYTLWDSFSGRKSYHAQNLLAEASREDERNAKLQLLLSVRSAYVQVQLELEELRLINDSLELARAQDRDVQNRIHAGAGTRLDGVTSQRSVLSYEIQFEQRQADLSSAFKDLLNLIGGPVPPDVSRPGPEGSPRVTLVLHLDSLSDLLKQMGDAPIAAPGDEQPQIRSQALQGDAYALNAESQSAKLFPTLQLSGSVSEILPDIPNPPSYLQETFAVSLNLPLFIGDSTRAQAAAQRAQAEAAGFRAVQLKQDISRDFAKAQELLASLRTQQKLAALDVAQSREEARLYYTSYKGGKINFIDVQNANVQQFQAQVNAARIDAQVLNQISILKSLSGKEITHD